MTDNEKHSVRVRVSECVCVCVCEDREPESVHACATMGSCASAVMAANSGGRPDTSCFNSSFMFLPYTNQLDVQT
jgi:hypothetical protein